MITFINNTVQYLDGNEKPIRFAKAIFSRRDLNSTEKLILIEIFDLSTKRGYCSAKNNYFMKGFGLSEKTVSRTLTSLLDKKMITMENRGDGGVDRVTMINPNIVKMTMIHSQVVQSENTNSSYSNRTTEQELSGEYIIEDKIINTKVLKVSNKGIVSSNDSTNPIRKNNSYKDINSLKELLMSKYPIQIAGITDRRALYNVIQVATPRRGQDEWMDKEWRINLAVFLKEYLDEVDEQYLVRSVKALKDKIKDWREFAGEFNFTAQKNEQK